MVGSSEMEIDELVLQIKGLFGYTETSSIRLDWAEINLI
jgi:hypothetical protein